MVSIYFGCCIAIFAVCKSEKTGIEAGAIVFRLLVKSIVQVHFQSTIKIFFEKCLFIYGIT